LNPLDPGLRRDDAVELLLGGHVQGVGFRPFVYLLAERYKINGWVRNILGRVEIHAQGGSAQLDLFRTALIDEAPPLSRPHIEREHAAEIALFRAFKILESSHEGSAAIHVPPDQATCAECEEELFDVANRRFRYPFINCTQCGPRYSIIDAMPYDRQNTSMMDFPLCDRCRREYENPLDRRFHAEPNACPDCGPQLTFVQDGNKTCSDDAAMQAAVLALRAGRILAVKGVGGYHLMCDAANATAVKRLRRNKHRPHKPLALMVAAKGSDDLEMVRQLVVVEQNAAAALTSQACPILLLKKRAHATVCDEIAPDLDELGVMLPPSPLHQTLTADFGGPVVATSGNISGEPVLTDDNEALQRLQPVAEGWLMHNRRIVRPADDSVARYMAGTPRMIRLGRGSAPLEWSLPFHLKNPVIAVGGHMKNSIALAWENRIVVSPHIGDLGSQRSQRIFRQVIADQQRLYQVKAERIICDLHPRYASSKWAQQSDLPITRVQHHHAHASALAGEHGRFDKGLVFSWDGVGLGDDGTLWGGEAFIGSPSKWRRVVSLRPFRVAGGDQVSAEPWRSAAALHWELGLEYAEMDAQQLARQAWQRGVNSISTTAVGRLFDAAAAILGLAQKASHEGEAPMRLEAIAERLEPGDSLPVNDDNGLLRIDWEPLFHLLDDQQFSLPRRAGEFHAMLAATLCSLAEQFHHSEQIHYVGLSGGVFQNALLVELISERLQQSGIELLLCERIPVNDGGLAFGQIIEYAASMNHHE
jgi:hydrogenase maturation protein HypF